MKNSDEFTNAENAKKKKVLEDHWWKIIFSWVNVTDLSNPLASQKSLKLPIIDIVDGPILLAWTQTLKKAGYVVTIERNLFVVSL